MVARLISYSTLAVNSDNSEYFFMLNMSNSDGESESVREKSLLSMYEQLLSDRFTERDAEYTRTLQQANPSPPCVENWYTRPKRTFDWTR